jgi:L-amino acid N-acyltransferase YncA
MQRSATPVTLVAAGRTAETCSMMGQCCVDECQFGFTDLRLHRIWATCRPDNQGSARVLEKIGMELEGQLRDHILIRGQWRDSLLYAAIN